MKKYFQCWLCRQYTPDLPEFKRKIEIDGQIVDICLECFEELEERALQLKTHEKDNPERDFNIKKREKDYGEDFKKSVQDKYFGRKK